MSLQTYSDVIEHLNKEKRQKILLLGNGFSIAYNPSIFSYNALSKLIEESKDELLVKLFKAIDSSNFEQLMRQLRLCKEIVKAFEGDEVLIEKIDQASSTLKEALINAINTLHPEHVFTIPESQSTSCASFLQDYLGKDGKIFSTNYDILLYWVLMRNNLPNAIDGFGRDVIEQGDWTPEDDVQLSELRWGNHKDDQNIFYLHGALPLFDDGIEIVKEQYDGDYILENIRRRMDRGQYPIFVTAGDGNEKLNHIVHNHYLAFCYDSLCSISGSLISFGFNFSDYDNHIIQAINEAAIQDIDKKLWSIYIGVYSDDDIAHIESIRKKFKCKVNLFDSRSVNIWG